jgi:phage shock protein PspC (stress-responsive transcriptional regulator)
VVANLAPVTIEDGVVQGVAESHDIDPVFVSSAVDPSVCTV